MSKHEALRVRINTLIDDAIEQFYASVPRANYLKDGDDIDIAYFKRHTIETILRIRLARVADGKAIAVLAQKQPKTAAIWARYAEEEMQHDRLFLKDLENLGVEEADVYNEEPLSATKLLQGYLYYTLEHEGALGLLSKAYFVEYSTAKTQRGWNQNIAKSLGSQSVRGAEAHLHIDETQDHDQDVWNAVSQLINTPQDEQRLIGHIKVYIGLFREYFSELHHVAGGQPVANGTAFAGASVAPTSNAVQ